jgi:hypothetical protein
MEFLLPPETLTHEHDDHGHLVPTKKRYLACRLTITLPHEPEGPDIDAVYEDIGAMDSGNFEGLKTLYSDARKRVAAATGIGAYLNTCLNQVILPQVNARQVDEHTNVAGLVLAVWPEETEGRRRPQLVIPPSTQARLRDGYRRRIETDAIKRDIGTVLSHGEPEPDSARHEGAVEQEAAHQAAGQPGEVVVALPRVATSDEATAA